MVSISGAFTKKQTLEEKNEGLLKRCGSSEMEHIKILQVMTSYKNNNFKKP